MLRIKALVLALVISSPAYANQDMPICKGFQSVFKSLASEKGMSPVLSEGYAIGATATFIEDIKNQRASDVVSLSQLEKFVPERARPGLTGYGNTAGIISAALGLKNITLLLSTQELRFLHLAERGVDVVVLAQNAASLTQERHSKLIDIAKNLGFRIHVIWVGSAPSESEMVKFDFTLLAALAAQTNGAVIDLSRSENPCAKSL